MHLARPSHVNQASMDLNALAGGMTPFTCWCCCAEDSLDAERLLNISQEKFREGDGQVEELLSQARESESLRGAVVIRMGRYQ